MNPIRRLLTILGFLLLGLSLFAQATDTLAREIKPKVIPVARKALLFSIIPGAGQIYNKKYWKVPIVYGGIGLAIYNINKNKKEYKRFDEARTKRIDGDPETIDTEFPGYTNDAIYRIRQGYDKNIQLSYIMVGVVYSLSIMDAFVDAHLNNFDVGDDLSLKVMPSSMDGMGLGFVGILKF